MEAIPPKGSTLQRGKVGVESAHGFGDCLFNVPLIKAISEKHKTKVTVTVRHHCADAFNNLPFINDVIRINEMHQGEKLLRERGYEYVYQITQNIKFFEFRNADQNHSLIDTPLQTGRQIGLDFDNRPVIIPTKEESSVLNQLTSKLPMIAIESVYTSAQSWANREHIMQIVDAYKDSHQILWLSNKDCPEVTNVDNMLRYTRRECIMCLSKCDYFFSVGSGFFCATLALPRRLQPKKTICLWKDELYKYEKRLDEEKWNSEITWVHNANELTAALESN